MSIESQVVSYIRKCFEARFTQLLEKRYRMFLRASKTRKGFVIVSILPVDIDLDNVLIDRRCVYHTGLIIGWVKGQNFVPSTELFNLAKMLGCSFGCAVEAKDQGVKAFLYGNDLLVASVNRFLLPVEKGWYVAVLDSDGFAIGVGRLVLGYDEYLEAIRAGKMLEVVVKNVFDLGMAIRDEEVFG